MKRRAAIAVLVIAALAAVAAGLLVLGQSGRGPATGLSHGPGNRARPAPASPPARPATQPPAPAPSPTPESAESFAGRAVVAYLSWRWDQPYEVIEQQVRPYVTDQLWQRLTTGPSSQWSNPGGRDAHEVDTVTVQTAQVVDRSGNGVTVNLTVTVTMHTDQGTSARPHWVQVHVIGQPGAGVADDIEM